MKGFSEKKYYKAKPNKTVSTNVFTISKPMYYFAKLWGLWPQTLTRSQPGIEPASLIWFCLLLSVYVYVFYLNLNKDFWKLFSQLTGSGIQTYGSWLQVLSGLGIGIVSLIVAVLTYKKQWKLFEMMDNVDEILRRDFTLLTPKQVYSTLIQIAIAFAMMIIGCLVSLTFYVYNVVLNFPSWMICISYFLYNMPYATLLLLFYFSSNVIKRRFRCINNILFQLSPDDMPKNVFEICSIDEKNDRHMPTISIAEIYSIYGSKSMNIPTKPPLNKKVDKQWHFEREVKRLESKIVSNENDVFEKIRRINVIELEEMKLSNVKDVEGTIEYLTKLLDLHDVLLDGISLQNELFSFQLLLIVAQIFIFEVFALFSMYRIWYNDLAQSKAIAFINGFWFVLYNAILYIIMSRATSCVDEAKYMGTCVHKVINKIADRVDPRIIDKLSVMSHQLTMRAPDITCGLFSFDWALIFSIISATCIYLIFLVQFDIADNTSEA